MIAHRRSQHGIALVTAILIVAIAAIASAAILSAANIAIRRTSNLQESEMAWWYATGVEQWAKTLLEQDADDNKFDSLQDIWAQPVDYLPVDNGAMRGRIVDQQGCFNLNNFATSDTDVYETLSGILQRLLEQLGADNPAQGAAIAAAVRDWIDDDIEPTSYTGAEDTEYLGYEMPYRVPNQLMTDVSELLAIKGVDRKLYQLLRDHVCALPATGTKINANTASPPLLAALIEGNGSRSELTAFLENRLNQPAESVSDLFDDGVFTAQDPGADLLSVDSMYFRAEIEVAIGSGHLSLYSAYKRPSGGVPVVYGRSTDTR